MIAAVTEKVVSLSAVGWIILVVVWALVIGLSVYSLALVLSKPLEKDDEDPGAAGCSPADPPDAAPGAEPPPEP